MVAGAQSPRVNSELPQFDPVDLTTKSRCRPRSAHSRSIPVRPLGECKVDVNALGI